MHVGLTPQRIATIISITAAVLVWGVSCTYRPGTFPRFSPCLAPPSTLLCFTGSQPLHTAPSLLSHESESLGSFRNTRFRDLGSGFQIFGHDIVPETHLLEKQSSNGQSTPACCPQTQLKGLLPFVYYLQASSQSKASQATSTNDSGKEIHSRSFPSTQ